MRSFIIATVFSLVSASFVTPVLAAPREDSWALARAVLARGDESAQATLVRMLESGLPEVAARAAKIIRVIGVAQPEAFCTILARADVTAAGRRIVLADLHHMPARSPSRAALAAIAANAAVAAEPAALAAPVADSKPR